MDEATNEYWDKLDRAISETSDARDRVIVTLAATALGASIALSELFKDPVGLVAIGWAWVMFAGSATSALISLEFAESARRFVMRQLTDGKPLEELPTRWTGGWRDRGTWVFNRLAVWTFVAGVGFLLWFALANLRGGE
jgi:hypothetical protein